MQEGFSRCSWIHALLCPPVSPSANTYQPLQWNVSVSFMWTWRTSSGALLAPSRTHSFSLCSPTSYPCSWKPAHSSVVWGQAGKCKTVQISLSQLSAGPCSSRLARCTPSAEHSISGPLSVSWPVVPPLPSLPQHKDAWNSQCHNLHKVLSENIVHLTYSEPPGITAR